MNVSLTAAVLAGFALSAFGADSAAFEWSAMGTRIRLLVRGGDADEIGPDMALAARQAMEEVESQTSAFRAESPVSRLRATAGGGDWIPVGAPFDAALDLALETARASGGAFNPLVAPLLEAHGFARRPPVVAASPSAFPPDSGCVTNAPETLLDLSKIERRPGFCRLRESGMALDFGALAKGLGVDYAVAATAAVATNEFLVDAGGNLAGRGDWTIGLRDPRAPRGAAPLRSFRLPGGTACATSGNYERHVVHPDGSVTGHLLDPRTASPASGPVLQTTAFAPTAARADAWSTALFVLGPEEGCHALARIRDTSAIWVLSGPGGSLRFATSNASRR